MENPAYLLGIPLLVVGALGTLIAMVFLAGTVRLSSWWFEPIAAELGGPAPTPPPLMAHEEHASGHPSALEYVRIGLALALVTIVEVAIFYADVNHNLLVTVLVALSALKFVLVVLWFMHLKFDSPIFSGFFTGAFALAAALFVVVLTTLGAGLV